MEEDIPKMVAVTIIGKRRLDPHARIGRLLTALPLLSTQSQHLLIDVPDDDALL